MGNFCSRIVRSKEVDEARKGSWKIKEDQNAFSACLESSEEKPSKIWFKDAFESCKLCGVFFILHPTPPFFHCEKCETILQLSEESVELNDLQRFKKHLDFHAKLIKSTREQDIDKSNLRDLVISYNKLLVEASKQMLKSSKVTARILWFHLENLAESSQKLSSMFVDDRVVAPETKLIFR
jgi:hypothetical protein